MISKTTIIAATVVTTAAVAGIVAAHRYFTKKAKETVAMEKEQKQDEPVIVEPNEPIEPVTVPAHEEDQVPKERVIDAEAFIARQKKLHGRNRKNEEMFNAKNAGPTEAARKATKAGDGISQETKDLLEMLKNGRSSNV